jgi:hypothetical protein
MFYHIVLMSFATEADADFFAKAETYVKRVKAECADVVSYFMTENAVNRSDGLTHAIIGMFATSAAHDAYQVSAAHQEMKAFMTARMARIVVLDADRGA